jgi:ATP/maltotriose-dependent transcriptional regulator MalT
MLLGRALSLAGRRAEHVDLLPHLYALATDGHDRAELAMEHASVLSFGLSRDDEAVAVLVDAESRVGDIDVRARLKALRAFVLDLGGHGEEAMAVADEVLAIPDATDEVRIRALRAKAHAGAIVGRQQVAVAAADEGLALVLETRWSYPQSLGWFWSARIQGLWLGGWWERALDEATLGVTVASTQPAITMRATTSFWLGQTLLSQGRVGEAIAPLRAAAALLREEDAGNSLPQALGALAHALALVGELNEARATVASLPSTPRGGALLSRFAFDIGTAWVVAAGGETSRAAAALVDAADRAAALALRGPELMLRHDALRLDRVDQVEPLLAVAALVDGPLASVCADHARAVADEDGDGLDQVAARFAGLPARLLAAEVSLYARAIHQRSGSPTKAAASAARAAAWLAETGDARTPRTAQTPAADPLTRREREIAELAASGLSNREIAERLVVSVRTIESHVYRVCGKLGVSDRRELASVLHPVAPSNVD